MGNGLSNKCVQNLVPGCKRKVNFGQYGNYVFYNIWYIEYIYIINIYNRQFIYDRVKSVYTLLCCLYNRVFSHKKCTMSILLKSYKYK